MDKVIEITNRAVADYGFRQAVLYGSADIAHRWGLTGPEQEATDQLIPPIITEVEIELESILDLSLIHI